MKLKEKIEAARKRVKELFILIEDWNLKDLENEIKAGNWGDTNYDHENIDNVQYLTDAEFAAVSFHILELQDGTKTERAVPDELIKILLNEVSNWQKKQLNKKLKQ